MKSIAILGGGISGLSVAFHLLKHSKKINSPIPKIKIFESQDRFGGWMKTVKCGQSSDDYFDLGPRTITTNSYAATNVISMVSDIGLSNKVKPVTANSKNFKKRYVIINDKIQLIPSTFKHIFLSQKPFKPFAKYLLRDFRTDKLEIKKNNDLSVDQFFRLRFGDEIADYLINPMCIGITGGDSKQLSIKSVFPRIFQGEQKYGSVLKSMIFSKNDKYQDLSDDPLVQQSKNDRWSVFTFDGGIETFVSGLVNYLHCQNVELSSKNQVEHLEFFDSNSQCRIDGESFDHVFSSLPSYGLSSILSSENEILKEALVQIPFVDMAVVSFKFPLHVQLPKNLTGFGFLVPSHENSQILGVIFDSSIFESSTTSKFTVMLGGYRFKQLFGSPDSVSQENLIKVSKDALKKYLNIDSEPIEILVSIHKKCIPQYNLGHDDRVLKIEQLTSQLPISLIGSSYHGFSVPDCIYNAKLEAIKYIKSNYYS